jgi:hypothetical protein
MTAPGGTTHRDDAQYFSHHWTRAGPQIWLNRSWLNATSTSAETYTAHVEETALAVHGGSHTATFELIKKLQHR